MMNNNKMLSYFDIKLREIVYSKGKDPEVFNPKIISIHEDKIKFGMWKHQGVLILNLTCFFDMN